MIALSDNESQGLPKSNGLTEPHGLTVDAVCRELGVTPRTLRYYEEVGLVAPVGRTAGGHRLYDEKNLDRLTQILRLKEYLGISLQEIHDIIGLERSLDEIRSSFHANRADVERQIAFSEQYITVLRQLIDKMDEKIANVSSMRENYRERLDKSVRALHNMQSTENSLGEKRENP